MYFKKKYIVSGFVIFLLTTIFLFRSIDWKYRLNNWVNQKIGLMGWEMKIEDSLGSFFGTTYLENVKFSHSLGSIIKIEKLSFNIGFISSIINHPVFVFDLITMEGLEANYISNQNSMNEEFYKNPIKIPFSVKSFFIDGLLTSNLNGHNNTFNILLGGELRKEQYSTIHFDLFKLAVDQNPKYNLHFDHLTMGDNGESYFLENIRGSFFKFSNNRRYLF